MVTLDWNFNRICNFKCRYCVNDPDDRIDVGPTAELVREFLKRLKREYSWILTGGEVFLNKDFVKICQLLTEKSQISINSNLSQSVDDFVKSINPERVNFIVASLHIEERKRLNNQQQLVDNINKLRESGFRRIFLIQVCDEYSLSIYDEIYEWFQKRGIYVVPRFCKSSKWFSMYYTDEQLRKIKYYRDLCYQDREIRDNKVAIIDYNSKSKGKLCKAGYSYLMSDSSGVVKECWSSHKFFGNLYGPLYFDENRIYDSPKVCPYEFCECLDTTFTTEC